MSRVQASALSLDQSRPLPSTSVQRIRLRVQWCSPSSSWSPPHAVKYRADAAASAIFQPKMACPPHLAFEDRDTESRSERYCSSQTRLSPSTFRIVGKPEVT